MLSELEKFLIEKKPTQIPYITDTEVVLLCNSYDLIISEEELFTITR